MNLGTNIDSTSPVNLHAGTYPVVTMPETVVSGAGVVLANTVLGRVTANGKLKPYASGNADGSEVAEAILTEEVDATSEDVPTTVYVTGEFNKAALVGIDAAAIIQLRKVGVFVKQILA